MTNKTMMLILHMQGGTNRWLHPQNFPKDIEHPVLPD